MPLEKSFRATFWPENSRFRATSPALGTRSANGQELFLVPERKWKHVTQPLGDLLALYGMFRHVSNDRLDLDRDAFWRYDPPRVIGLPLTHLLGGHGLRWLLPSRVLPRKGTG